MLEPAPSLIAFFEHLERDLRRCEADVHETIVEKLHLYCSDKALLAAVDGKRSVLAAMVAEIVRNKLMEHDFSIMAAFDGATEMSSDGTSLNIRDQDEREWPDNLHARLMDYFVDRGLQ